MPWQHVDNDEGDDEEGDRHNDEMATRARATMRGMGKTRGTTMAATPPPPPCTTRGMRTTWRGTTMTTTRTATTITMMTTQHAWRMPTRGDDNEVEVAVGTVR